MVNKSKSEEEIYYAALKEPPEGRSAYVKAACGDDLELLERVESLLKIRETTNNFLESPPFIDQLLLSSGLLTENEFPEEQPGTIIDRYKLLEKIGEGGMAVVYMAEQTEPIRRKVAFKIIKLGMDTKSVIARFEAERQALAMMDHPNIAKVFDAGATETGRPYFVMELVHGVSITAYCDNNKLDTRRRLNLMVQVCHAVQHAHQKGIIHRDIKPSNVLVTMHDDKPVPKVIDFGIAKATNQRLTEKTVFTRYAHFIGTPAYMSPEQAQMSGLDVDTRTDIYSLGVLLYELLTGVTPFDAEKLHKAGYTEIQRIICETEPLKPSTKLSKSGQTLIDVARQRQANPETLHKSVKGDLDWIVMKCLEKDRKRRYETVHELAGDIERHLRNEPILAGSPGFVYRAQKFWKRHQSQITTAAVITVLVAGLIITAWMYLRSVNARKVQWAKGEALPEIIKLVEQQDYRQAFTLAKRVKEYISDDPALNELWPLICKDYTITTTPVGASAFYREYSTTDAPWEYLGQSPLKNATLPQGVYRWKIEKKGFDTHECVTDKSFDLQLHEKDRSGEMVWIAAIKDESGKVEMPEFLMDKYEVTNWQFKVFVDAGGYENAVYWEDLDFVKDGRPISWQEAMIEFRDRTGRPGPATWEEGTYTEGKDKHPVSGVSWFEATAYANFVNKSLPTIHHWQHAACLSESLVIVPFSNFSMDGTAPVGSHAGVGHTGVFDMAGNVREWCFNATSDSSNLRYLLGGAWGESTYMFTAEDSQSPWDRSAQNGFRCVQLRQGQEVLTNEFCRPHPLRSWRDYNDVESFSDKEFRSIRTLYQYDRTPLNAVVEMIDNNSPFWRRQKITFDAAYGKERVTIHLFLPKTGKPPYQTVFYFPGMNAVYETSFNRPPYRSLCQHIVASGRAMLFPIYYGTYERPSEWGRTWTFADVIEKPITYRDWTVRMVKDLSRSIDYLETRDDINSERIAYYGYSMGSLLGSIMLSVEDRIDTGILVHGGLPPIDLPRSLDVVLYAQRVKIPVLMVNGDKDVLAPIATCQVPLYRNLGTPEEHKDRRLYPGGHGTFALFYDQISADVLSWLDRYLGHIE